MTLLEAMSLGIPAVVTDVGGNPEIVDDGRTGFLTPSDNAPAFAEAMSRLHGSPSLSLSMSENAKQRFQQHFSVATMAGHYYNLYLRVLQQ